GGGGRGAGGRGLGGGGGGRVAEGEGGGPPPPPPPRPHRPAARRHHRPRVRLPRRARRSRRAPPQHRPARSRADAASVHGGHRRVSGGPRGVRVQPEREPAARAPPAPAPGGEGYVRPSLRAHPHAPIPTLDRMRSATMICCSRVACPAFGANWRPPNESQAEFENPTPPENVGPCMLQLPCVSQAAMASHIESRLDFSLKACSNAARSAIDWANCSTARRVSTRWLAAMSDGSMAGAARRTGGDPWP